MSNNLTIHSISGEIRFDDDSMVELFDAEALDLDDIARIGGEIVDREFDSGTLRLTVDVEAALLDPDLDKAAELTGDELCNLDIDMSHKRIKVTHDYDNVFLFTT